LPYCRSDAHAAKIIPASCGEKQGWDAIIKIIIGEMWLWGGGEG
jgi:hypothetical protein